MHYGYDLDPKPVYITTLVNDIVTYVKTQDSHVNLPIIFMNHLKSISGSKHVSGIGKCLRDFGSITAASDFFLRNYRFFMVGLFY